MKALGVGVRRTAGACSAARPDRPGPPTGCCSTAASTSEQGWTAHRPRPSDRRCTSTTWSPAERPRGADRRWPEITRQKAISFCTSGNGWFSREENALGAVEAGRLADLAVLDADVFDPKDLPDEAIARALRADDPRREDRARKRSRVALTRLPGSRDATGGSRGGVDARRRGVRPVHGSVRQELPPAVALRVDALEPDGVQARGVEGLRFFGTNRLT